MTDATCSRMREVLSLDHDHERSTDHGFTVEDAHEAHVHVEQCAECQRFAERLGSVRTALRFEAIGATPDVSERVGALLLADRESSASNSDDDTAAPLSVVSAVSSVSSVSSVSAGSPDTTASSIASVSRPRRRVWSALSVAACFLVGLLIGSTLVTGRDLVPPPAAAATVPERVAAAQRALRALDAELEVHEYGWQAAAPSRSFEGRLRFAAPESLAFSLRDTTAYPDAGWAPNDVDLVVRDGVSWTSGLRSCTTPVTPACGSGDPSATSISNREPFDAGSVAPLDLLVPVRSFSRAEEPSSLGSAVLDGRAALGVVTTAAQAAPLLDGFRPAGNLRSFYPTDRVELWLDEAALVPLSIRVIASADDERRLWASNHGYTEQGSEVLFTVALHRVVIDATIDPQVFRAPAPAGAADDDAGFTPSIDLNQRGGIVEPSSIPDTFTPVRSGTVAMATSQPVVVRTWASGRAWLKVRVTDRWTGQRLFGGMGVVVRPIRLADGSAAYTNAEGTKVAVHAGGIDVVVEGSLTTAELTAVASSLGVVGSPVPDDWAEAATSSYATAARLVPGIVVPHDVHDFDAPALRSDGSVFTASYAGAGDRAFTLVASPGDRLGPPLDVHVSGVEVRGMAGRYSSVRGELEWVESGVVYALRSSTMSMGELLGITTTMTPA